MLEPIKETINKVLWKWNNNKEQKTDEQKQAAAKDKLYQEQNKEELRDVLIDKLKSWAYQSIQRKLITRRTPNYFVDVVVDSVFKEKWDIMDTSMSSNTSFAQYENTVMNCPLDVEAMSPYLNMKIEINHNITRKLYDFHKATTRTIGDKELKDKLNELVEQAVRNAVDEDSVSEADIKKEIKKRQKKYEKNRKYYARLVNYKRQWAICYKEERFFIVQGRWEKDYIFSDENITLNHLWSMATSIEGLNKYELIILKNWDDNNSHKKWAFDLWNDDVYKFSKTKIKKIRNVDIPELQAYLYTSLLPEGSKIDDFKITIPSDKEKNVLIQVDYNNGWRHLSHSQTNTVYSHNILRTAIWELGWETNSAIATDSLTVWKSEYRAEIVTNPKGMTMVIRKTDGWTLDNKKDLAAKVSLPVEEIDNYIIDPSLLDYANDREKYEEEREKLMQKENAFFLDPYKKIEEVTDAGYKRKANYNHGDLSLPYTPEFKKRVLESLDEQIRENGGISFWVWPTKSWKSSSTQMIVNELYDKRVNENAENLNFFTAENPIEKHNQYLTQYEVDDVSEREYLQLVKTLKRQNADIVFVWELRSPEVFGAMKNISDSFPVISTIHATSLSVFLENLSGSYVSEAKGLNNKDTFKALTLVVVHRVITIAKDSATDLEYTQDIKAQVNNEKRKYTEKDLDEKETKMFDMLQETIERYNKKGLLAHLPKNKDDKRPKLYWEYANSTNMWKYVNSVDDIDNDIQAEKIYDHVALNQTIFYMILETIIEGKAPLKLLPIKEYANSNPNIVINILKKFNKDHQN